MNDNVKGDGDQRVVLRERIGSLTFIVMEQQKRYEKALADKYVGNSVSVEWVKFTGGAMMNDAILSGNLRFALAGVGPLAAMWAKTRGNLEVMGVCASNSMPMLLNTRNPNVKTIADFGKLNPLTVTLSHADGMLELLSPKSPVDSHFTSPPYTYLELEHPGIHTVLDSYQILGGPSTLNVVYTTSKFRVDDPKVYAAFLKAFKEATDFINQHKDQAADIYLEVSKDKSVTKAQLLKILDNPDIRYTMAPQRTMEVVNFMHKMDASAAACASRFVHRSFAPVIATARGVASIPAPPCERKRACGASSSRSSRVNR